MFSNKEERGERRAFLSRVQCSDKIAFFFSSDVPLVSAQISCLSVMGELGKAWNIFQSSVNNSVIPRRGAALHLTNTALDQNDESKVLQMLDFYRKEEYKIADHGASKIILAAIKDKKWTDAVWKLLEIYKHSLLPFEESIAYKFVNWFERFVRMFKLKEMFHNVIINIIIVVVVVVMLYVLFYFS